jgi:hypothetical protein
MRITKDKPEILDVVVVSAIFVVVLVSVVAVVVSLVADDVVVSVRSSPGVVSIKLYARCMLFIWVKISDIS